ncbi:MAG TPA: lipopolysaccharide transport periplasmic protein LptA [Candidatus Deferrimicrobiaceae bacterium]|nr:lipopolysaccharide transport periplasmic protein LptA [Candidatus Deferrimicrobiaceae bacterium]
MSGRTERKDVIARVATGRRCSLLFFLVLAFCAGGAEAQRGVRPDDLGSQPIDITADRLSADSARESVTFEGNVEARQGNVTLHADRLFAEYSRSAKAIEKITAEGNVRVIQGAREARADRAVFYNLEQRIVLTGGADLVQGENTLKGETVTIYLRENRSVVTGGEGGRVQAVIHPQGMVKTKEKEDH